MLKNPIIKIALFHSTTKSLTMATTFFLAIHLNNIGISGFQIGTLFAVATLTSILTIIPSGFINDKANSKNLITLSLILNLIHFAGLSRFEDYPILLALFFSGGLGLSIYIASIDSLFLKTSKNDDTAKKIGIYQGLNYLFMGITIIIAGYILNAAIPFQELFKYTSYGFLILIIISQIILPNNKSTKFDIIHYKKDLLNPQALALMMMIFLFALHFGAEQTNYGLFLKNYFNLNNLEIGLYMGSAIMVMAPSAIFLSKKIDKFKAKNVLLFGLLISGLGHILMTVKTIELSFLFRVIHEIADSCTMFFLFFGVSKIFNLKRMGGNMGIIHFTSYLGTAIGALLFGPIGAQYGYHIPLIASGCTTLIAFILSLRLINHFDHK